MSRMREKTGSGRRKFLGTSMTGLAGSLVACNRNELGAPAQVAVAAGSAFSTQVSVEGGLYRLVTESNTVEIAYPLQMNDGHGCDSPTHHVLLRVHGDPNVTAVEMSPKGPWKLDDMTVTVAVSGSSTKPDPTRWRTRPGKEIPEEGNTAEETSLDWIPTIDGKARDWRNRAITKLVFETGDWVSDRPRQDEMAYQLWNLQASPKALRAQHITDRARWEDLSDGGPTVVTFQHKRGPVSTLSFEPKKKGGVVSLEIGAHESGPPIGKGEAVKHYCLYYSLLDILDKDKFIPYRVGGISTGMRVQPLDVPGRFCPGGKIIG